MEATPHSTATASPAHAVDPVYLENTLLRVFGVLFCHDPKRARQRTGSIAINRGVQDRNITVRLDPEYGQPGPFAHKVAMAIVRKHSGYGRPVQAQISFTQRELGRLCGRDRFGGRDSEELTLALKQIRYAHVLAHFKLNNRLVEHDFSIFNEVLLERRASPSDPIVACTLVLADPIIKSLNDRHFTCLNHALMQQLGTIGQAFYMRLFFHFSTHFDGHHKERLTFKKRYDDICNEWLGGLTVHAHRSKIIGEQLGTHLNQLVQVGFLTSYQVAPAERREGFVISFRPGPAFFADYQRFYTSRAQGEIQFKFHEERETIGEPHQVAYLFVEKRTGRKRDAVPFVSSRDVATAKELLGHIPMSEMSDFLGYALAEAAKTRFDLQTLGGVRQYLNGYRELKRARGVERAAAAVRQEEAEHAAARVAYNAYHRAEADRLFGSLPAEERAEIEALVRVKIAPGGLQTAYMTETLSKLKRTQITAERHADRILSFDDWQRSRLQ